MESSAAGPTTFTVCGILFGVAESDDALVVSSIGARPDNWTRDVTWKDLRVVSNVSGVMVRLNGAGATSFDKAVNSFNGTDEPDGVKLSEGRIKVGDKVFFCDTQGPRSLGVSIYNTPERTRDARGAVEFVSFERLRACSTSAAPMAASTISGAARFPTVATLLISLAGATTVLGTFVVMRHRVTMFGFLAGFSRLSTDALATQKTRAALIQAVRETGGIRAAELRRTLELSPGTFYYHLHRLQLARLVAVVARRGRSYVVPPGTEDPEPVSDFERVQAYYERFPTASSRVAAAALGIPDRTIRHLRKSASRKRSLLVGPPKPGRASSASQ